MSTLIEELKQEHKVITETLRRVSELGIGSKEGQETLIAAKAGLLTHLSKEDEVLYPTLRKAAEHDAALQRTLDFFAKDMEQVSARAIRFFETYTGGGSGITFAEDFGELFAMLNMRIRKEEDILFQEYERITQQPM